MVHLTEEGSKLIRRVFAEHERNMERVFSGLDKPERKALASLLRKLLLNASGCQVYSEWVRKLRINNMDLVPACGARFIILKLEMPIYDESISRCRPVR